MATSMALRTALRPLTTSTAILRSAQRNTFSTSRRLLEGQATVVAARKPAGAFRGGLFGFLLGSTAAGSAIYYYILNEYKVSNELLMDDVFALQATVQRVEGYVRGLEERVNEMQSKK